LSGNSFAAFDDLKGELIWINGPIGSGRTTLCLDVSVQALSAGKAVLYIQNPEHVTLNSVINIGKSKGLVFDEDDFLLADPEDLQHALVLLEEGISLDPSVIVIDTLDQLVIHDHDRYTDLKAQLLEFLTILRAFTINDHGVVFITTTTENSGLWFISLLEKFETCMVEIKVDEKKSSRQFIFLRDSENRSKNFDDHNDSRMNRTSSSNDWI